MATISYTSEQRSTTRFASGLMTYDDETCVVTMQIFITFRKEAALPEIRVAYNSDLVKIAEAGLFLKATNRMCRVLNQLFIGKEPLGPSFDPSNNEPIGDYINRLGSVVLAELK